MPDINPQYAQFESDLKKLLEELMNRIRQANLSKVELAQLVSEVDFFEELKSLGFEELVNSYFDNYDTEIATILQQAKDLGVNFANVDIDKLSMIKELDKEYLLGSAKAWSSQLQSELVKSSIRGDSVPESLSNLQNIPLTDSQLTTVLNTSYWDTSKLATVEAYKSIPEQRFRYVAGMNINSPTKSEICRWLLLNQDPKGYTMAEIQKGIVTPFGMVDELGRVPNFNCGDTWQVMSAPGEESLTDIALRIKREKESKR